MSKPDEKDAEYQQEAERLACLPMADQQEVIALHRSVAENSKVPKTDREEAGRRADALSRHLRRLKRAKEKT